MCCCSRCTTSPPMAGPWDSSPRSSRRSTTPSWPGAPPRSRPSRSSTPTTPPGSDGRSRRSRGSSTTGGASSTAPRPPPRRSRLVPHRLLDAVKALARQERTTLFTALLAAFQTLLHRYTGQTDLVVGTAIAGRPLLETEPLIGFFVNTLALRTDCSGDPPFRDFLRRVRDTALGAYAHQDLPFHRLVHP